MKLTLTSARRSLHSFSLCGFLLGAASPLTAATLTVANLDDSGSGSLRQAIADAAPGDTIDFAVTGTITLTSGELVITNDLTISGPGVTNLTVSGNNASRVFSFINVTASVSGLTVANGYWSDSAGINNSGGLLVVSGCFVQCNTNSTSPGFGGGIGNAGTLIVINSEISRNQAGNGGGIYNAGLLAATNSTFSGNRGVGAGIRNDGTATLSGCTLSGNIDDYGGALAQVSWAGPCLIVNCTFASNIGRGIRLFGSSVDIANSIVAGNSGTPDAPDLVTLPGGVINSLDYNLIGNTNGATITGLTTHNIYGQDPLLGPLADNGGPTLTHALLPGSPAIDHGSSGGLATDQRGQPRIFNFPAYFDADDASDIGAYELQERAQTGPVFTVNTTDDAEDGVAGIAHCSLREAIAAANANADTNTIDFAAAVPGLHTGVTGTITLTNGQLTITNSVNINGPGAANLKVSGNNAGRVFYNYLSPLFISGLTIADGLVSTSSDSGGGILNAGGSLLISDCVVSNCVAWRGGGICSVEVSPNGGSVQVNRSTITKNAGNYGAGGGLFSIGWTRMLDTTICSNNGGGVYDMFMGGITNSTISGNFGIGLFHDQTWVSTGYQLPLTGCTICSNSGVGIYVHPVNSSVVVRAGNTIVAGNSGGSGPDCSGRLTSEDFNLIQNTNGVVITGTTTHNIYNLDPKLGPLADLGGPTPTHALRFDSPALDAGHSGGLTTDQRGLPRPIDSPDIANAEGGDGSDIGAYEADPNFRIMAIEKVGSDIRLRFNTVLGRNYRLDSEDNLNNSWSVLTNDIIGAGSSVQAVDSGAATLPRRFYRGVMLLP